MYVKASHSLVATADVHRIREGAQTFGTLCRKRTDTPFALRLSPLIAISNEWGTVQAVA